MTVQQESKTRMEKAIEALHNELKKLRTGRAHPSLLDAVKIPYYGSDTPLNQVANIAATDSRTLTITPWEKSLIPAIEKAIHASDLGLNPVTTGDVTRIPLPPLNEERRRELIKIVKNTAEQTRVSLRNIRRDANQQLKDSLKNKEITEDDEHHIQEEIQKLTDQFIAEVEKIVHAKEHELLEV